MISHVRGSEEPIGQKIEINGVVSRDILLKPESHNKPDFIVIKDGPGTGLTVGCLTGMESFVCNSAGRESVELAVYNFGYDERPRVFSAGGDSGSLIIDGLGRMVGLLHAGTGSTEDVDVSYATPMHQLWPRIKETYKYADFDFAILG